MTVEIRFEKVMFHKIVSIPSKKNCDQCNFGNWDLCHTALRQLDDMCDHGKNGYWTFERTTEGVLNDN